MRSYTTLEGYVSEKHPIKLKMQLRVAEAEDYDVEKTDNTICY